MQKIIVASKNPVKIKAALAGFSAMFPSEQFEVKGISANSEVSEQPKNDQETLQGTLNRARNASVAEADADFWVGMEGGIEEKGGETEAFAWMVVRGKDGKIGKGRTGVFFLPKLVVDLLRQGKELGEADDIVFKRENSKQVNGAIGLLTDNIVDRAKYYQDAIVFALIPFKNKKLY